MSFEKSEIQRAAVIQGFEIAFELAWKYLKSLLEEDSSLPSSPKSAIRDAANHGIIDDPENWFKYLEMKNLTVHTYREELAKTVYSLIEDEFIASIEN